jgi:hypothetical protein
MKKKRNKNGKNFPYNLCTNIYLPNGRAEEEGEMLSVLLKLINSIKTKLFVNFMNRNAKLVVVVLDKNLDYRRYMNVSKFPLQWARWTYKSHRLTLRHTHKTLERKIKSREFFPRCGSKFILS